MEEPVAPLDHRPLVAEQVPSPPRPVDRKVIGERRRQKQDWLKGRLRQRFEQLDRGAVPHPGQCFGAIAEQHLVQCFGEIAEHNCLQERGSGIIAEHGVIAKYNCLKF